MAEEVSRYLAVAEQLKEDIDRLGRNALLPSEELLSQRFKVSRVTIRRALAVLERAGLIDRHRGRGTIVNPPKVTRSIMPLLSIEQDFAQQGLAMTAEVLAMKRNVALPDRVRDRLECRAGEHFGMISLRRWVDDRVVSHDRRFLADAVCGRLDLKRIETTPLSVLILNEVGKPITETQWNLEFEPASVEVAKVLGITPGTLVVASVSTDYLEGGMPVQVSEVFYRIDRVKFSFAAEYRLEGDQPEKTAAVQKADLNLEG